MKYSIPSHVGIPEVLPVSAPVENPDSALVTGKEVDPDQFSDPRWPFASLMYSDLADLDQRYDNVYGQWRGYYAGAQEAGRELAEARRSLGATEAMIVARLKEDDPRIQGRSKPEREKKRDAVVVSDLSYQDALKIVNECAAIHSEMEMNLEITIKGFQKIERQIRWRERWLGFLSTVSRQVQGIHAPYNPAPFNNVPDAKDVPEVPF